VLLNAPTPRQAPDDLAGRLEFAADPDAPKGNALPALARLLRRLRDAERQRAGNSPGSGQKT
jgi:hypothetical protein